MTAIVDQATSTATQPTQPVNFLTRWKRWRSYQLTPQITELWLPVLMWRTALSPLTAAVWAGTVAVGIIAGTVAVTPAVAYYTRRKHIRMLLKGEAHVQTTYTRWARTFARQLGVDGRHADIDVIVHGDMFDATCHYNGRRRPATIVVGQDVEHTGVFGLAVVAHEVAHAARRDSVRHIRRHVVGWVTAIATIAALSCVAPVIGIVAALAARPAMRIFTSRAERDAELAADRISAQLVSNKLAVTMLRILDSRNDRNGSFAERISETHPSPARRQAALLSGAPTPAMYPQLLDLYEQYGVEEAFDFEHIDRLDTTPAHTAA